MDDNYLSRFNSRLEKMNLAGGAHVLCIPQIIDKDLSQCTTAEINTQKEKFKATCFVLRAEKSCYVDLLEELRKELYKGRDEYPINVSDAYGLLMRTSQQIGYAQIRPGQYGYC